MNAVAISCEGLSKRYRIGRRPAARTLRETLVELAMTPWQRLRGAREPGTGDRDAVWALRDVSFEVPAGDVLGVIGRNGAGKSTLLKLLSRITDPTAGTARIDGRVGSLLEVGTGFHPELTGRENVFLSGAVLGMTRREIKSRFDAIVDFAGVGPFIDTPIKRYSSGMHVRLGFAVAAHLEPEILLVDEVLAVGDAAFQARCLGKMAEVAGGGRTVLFVSHNMSAVARICERALLLDGGRLVGEFPAGEAVRQYLAMGRREAPATVDLTAWSDRSGDGSARIIRAALKDADGRPATRFAVADTVVVEFEVELDTPVTGDTYSIELTSGEGAPVYHLWDADTRTDPLPQRRRRIVRAMIPDVSLFPDRYHLTLWVGDSHGHRADRVANCLSFTVEQIDGRFRRPLCRSKGLVVKTANWSYADAERLQSNAFVRP